MGQGPLTDVLIRASAPFYRWRSRSVRKRAVELYAAHGRGAVELLREQIAACSRYQDRRRLYQLHDEIARRIPGGL